MPNTAVKCGDAPQKIMYLADDHFRKSGVRDKSNVIFASAQGSLLAVQKYRKTLEKVAARKAIDVRLKHNLVEIKPDQKEAIFENLDTKEQVTIPFDMIHVTPPMSAPDIIKSSTLANAAGWVDVDKYTLQHPKFPNVFPIGDCSGLPTSKTGAAVRKQAPVLVRNLIAAIQSEPLIAKYDGYTSCPLVTGYGKLVLAEFDYEWQTQRNVSVRSVERAFLDVFAQGIRAPSIVLGRNATGSRLKRKTISQQLMDKSKLSSEKLELDRVAHWENVYSTKQTTEVSWFEAEPTASLTVIDRVLPQGGRIIDVGGGASFFVDRLVERGTGVLLYLTSRRQRLNTRGSDLAKQNIKFIEFAMKLLRQRNWQSTMPGMTEPSFTFLPIKMIAKHISAD